jgi:hypothetical protein
LESRIDQVEQYFHVVKEQLATSRLLEERKRPQVLPEETPLVAAVEVKADVHPIVHEAAPVPEAQHEVLAVEPPAVLEPEVPETAVSDNGIPPTSPRIMLWETGLSIGSLASPEMPETPLPNTPRPILTVRTSYATETEEAVAIKFHRWCQRGMELGWPTISRHAIFQEFLQRYLAPAITVKAIYLDANAVRKEFGRSGQVTNAVEYWLVCYGGKEWLFPQPLNATQFRNTTCFEGGSVTPASLQSIVPALVQDTGSVMVLEAKGKLI